MSVDRGAVIIDSSNASARTARLGGARRARTRVAMSTAERQAQIVEAAVRLIGLNGIERTTVAQIAAEVGLSAMGPYRHFETKAEIVRAAFLYLQERILGWLRCSSHPFVPQRLWEIGEAHLPYLTEDVEMYNAPMVHLITTMPANAALNGEDVNQVDRIPELLIGILEEGKAQGSIRADADSVSFALQFIAWTYGEDLSYLGAALPRAREFSREPHMRMLELMIHDVAVPGVWTGTASSPGSGQG